MVALIVVLLVLALGELDPARAGTQNHADVLALGGGEILEIESGILSGLFDGKKSHRHRSLHAVLVFLRDVAIKVEAFDFGGDAAR
jgi:hypothetical protein